MGVRRSGWRVHVSAHGGGGEWAWREREQRAGGSRDANEGTSPPSTWLRTTSASSRCVSVALAMTMASGCCLVGAPGAALADEPFTLFGVVVKKNLVEELDEGGTKVVARKSGFSVNACVAGYNDEEIGPGFSLTLQDPSASCVSLAQPLPGIKEKTNKEQLAARAGVCAPTCRRACTEGKQNYVARQVALLGSFFEVDDDKANKVVDACSKRCTDECAYKGERQGTFNARFIAK